MQIEKNINQVDKGNGQKIRALVCGYTGATGKALIEALIASPHCESIVAIGRRENLEFKGMPKLTQHIVQDMSKISSVDPLIAEGCNVAFCCIGTPFNQVTNKSKQDAYRAVDFGIATEFAKFARLAGVNFLATITGEGTDKESNSNKNMYRVKKDVEDFVQTLGFERIALIRPGFLNRGIDAGWMERIMLPGVFGIPVEKVAKSMIWASLNQTQAVVGYNGNKELKKLADEFEQLDKGAN